MGSFDSRTWKIYLDQDAQDRRDEILDHLKKNYDGPSDFVQQSLENERALSIEERIMRLEQDRKEIEQDLQKLKQIKSEREQMDKLRDKKELLKEKQKKLREISNEGVKSEEEVRQEVVEEIREKAQQSYKIDNVEEYMSKDRVQSRIQRRVESRLDSTVEVDELVQDIERLQSQIAELNGGREDWFMDLSQQETEVEA